MLLPVLVPDFVLAYSWLRAYARAGLTSEAFGFAWPQVQGRWASQSSWLRRRFLWSNLITVVGLSTRANRPPSGPAAHPALVP